MGDAGKSILQVTDMAGGRYQILDFNGGVVDKPHIQIDYVRPRVRQYFPLTWTVSMAVFGLIAVSFIWKLL